MKEKNYGLYATQAELAREFGVDRETVRKRVNLIRDQIEKGRYNKYAVCGSLISKTAFLDITKYQSMLKDRFMRDHVPEFDPIEIANNLGMKLVRLEKDYATGYITTID